MATKALIFSGFAGGLSSDPKVGIKNSQQYVQAFDFRKSPSQLSVLPGMVREDKNIVRDLILNEVMTRDGTIYSFGDAGYIYRRTTAASYSETGQLSSGYAGIDYRQDADAIYLASAKSASLFNNISGTPQLMPDKYGISYSTYDNSLIAGFNVNSHQVGSSLTTAIVVATSPLNETAGNVRYLQTDIEPLNKVSVFVVAKGTGNWTLTLHDGLNNVLGTATISSANVVNNTWNDFVFTSAPNGQVRVYPAPNARTYHIHITSTVADGTISSSAVNDLSTCDLEIWADRFVQTNNKLHPIQRFQQFETIGNGNYLSVWEPISDTPTNDEWKRHRLVFPQEYEVGGLAQTNEFLVIAAGKNTTSNNSVPQQGILFFWDGTSDTYNYDVPIEEGTPQALHVYKNVAYYYAGGDWWAITSPTTQPVKLRSMPGSGTEFSGSTATITVYPYAATVRRGIHLMGWPGAVTNPNINFGVYSWGATDKNFPEALGYNYLPSTGSQNYSASNNLQIGMVKSYGDTLHLSWRDDLNGGYGIDVVNNASNPAPTAVWRSLTFDNNYVAKQKTANYMEAYYNLPAGATVTLAYSIDGGAYVSSSSYTSTTLWEGQPNYARFDITDGNGGRFHDITLQLTITCDATVTTPPNVQLVALVFDTNSNEVLQ